MSSEETPDTRPSTGITRPHEHDVLSGRGNKINQHAGNIYFRHVVATQKLQYVASRKEDKPLFARYVYNQIRARNPPGRFLKLDKKSNEWEDIGETRSIVKARQALREKAPEIQKEMKEETRKRLLNSVSVATHQTQQSINRMDHLNSVSAGITSPGSIHSHSSATSTAGTSTASTSADAQRSRANTSQVSYSIQYTTVQY